MIITAAGDIRIVRDNLKLFVVAEIVSVTKLSWRRLHPASIAPDNTRTTVVDRFTPPINHMRHSLWITKETESYSAASQEPLVVQLSPGGREGARRPRAANFSRRVRR